MTALADGDYAVASPNWNEEKGAVTLGNGAAGTKGSISAANSVLNVTRYWGQTKSGAIVTSDGGFSGLVELSK